jgi:HSP20 family protein
VDKMVKKKTKKININSKKKNKLQNKEIEKTPVAWNPWDIMESFDRMFWDDPWTPFWNKRWGGLIPRRKWYEQLFDTDTKITAVDMVDTGKEYKITAEMPGVNKNDIEVNVTENQISICGETQMEKKEDDEGWIRRERSYSSICRTMAFPEEVNPDKADATLKDGILEITVNKKKPTTDKGRNIPVK